MFTLLSWNVLADAYVRASYYPSSPPALLSKGVRTDAIARRLAASSADVICLQEAEPAVVEVVRDSLEGYAAHYLRKGGGKPDGCATFVRSSRLSVKSVREIAYADGEPASGHVALVVEIADGALHVLVANTHLKWDPPDVARSARFATRQIAQLLLALRGETPAIICGDFNVTPEDVANDAFEEAKLVDAYAHVPEAFTVVTGGRAKRIDYIRHSTSLALEALPVPRVNDSTPLPSLDEPSDHLPISVRVRE